MSRVTGFYRRKGKTRPITESKGEPEYSGQTSDPGWKKSSLESLRKEEASTSKKYERMAETAPTKAHAEVLQYMSGQEAVHSKTFEGMKENRGRAKVI